MKILQIKTLHCDAGWRPWTFIKITTDEGLVGWSECTDSHGSSRGLSGVIKDLEGLLVGEDPRATEKLYWDLYRATRQSPGSIIQKALGGIENALLDIKAKALGIPVYELFGGPLRRQIQVYWSHCGTTRARAAHLVGQKPLESWQDVVELGREVVRRGFKALKTNIIIPGTPPSVFMPGFGKGGSTDQIATPEIIRAIEVLMGTVREAVGPKVEICLDLNFNFKPEGLARVGRSLEQFDLMWLEMDCFDHRALRAVKEAIRVPVCSGENLYTARGYLPYFESHAMDVAACDVIWNGLAQSKKIADLAELYEMNVAPHNHYSHLATFICAHFCASIPHARILEVDIDDVAWKDELVTAVPLICDGNLEIPSGPGWGAEINEEVLKRHPWPR